MRSCISPTRPQQLKEYDAVILSDCGSNTLLLHPQTFKGVRRGNRLLALCEYVEQGGGLFMCGGYLSFSGVANKARYGMTPLAKVLPVEVLNYDDRMEYPEGVTPIMQDASHPVLQGVAPEWPHFLGYNKIKAKPQAQLIATMGTATRLWLAWNTARAAALPLPPTVSNTGARRNLWRGKATPPCSATFCAGLPAPSKAACGAAGGPFPCFFRFWKSSSFFTVILHN